jgi:hypothetical protein
MAKNAITPAMAAQLLKILGQQPVTVAQSSPGAVPTPISNRPAVQKSTKALPNGGVTGWVKSGDVEQHGNYASDPKSFTFLQNGFPKKGITAQAVVDLYESAVDLLK